MTQFQLADWNELYPLGSPCQVIMDDRTELQSHTRSEVFGMIPGGEGVVLVEGITGPVDLDKVKMDETHQIGPATHVITITLSDVDIKVLLRDVKDVGNMAGCGMAEITPSHRLAFDILKKLGRVQA